MKRKKPAYLKDLEAAARPARRRNRRAPGVKNMVEAETVYFTKDTAKTVTAEMELLGLAGKATRAEFLGMLLSDALRGISAAREAATAAASPIIQPDFKVVDGGYVGRRS